MNQYRREHAPLAHLTISMSAISNFESTLSKFKEDVEKEKALAFLTYVKLAIFGSIASETMPQSLSTSENFQSD